MIEAENYRAPTSNVRQLIKHVWGNLGLLRALFDEGDMSLRRYQISRDFLVEELRLLRTLPRGKTLYEITGGAEVYAQMRDCRTAALAKIKAVENG